MFVYVWTEVIEERRTFWIFFTLQEVLNSEPGVCLEEGGCDD